jgi:hypothetical protein
MDPADKKNVNKSLSSIWNLSHLAGLPLPSDPFEQKQHHAILFLVEFLSLFVDPFIDVDMDLGTQIELLSTYTHFAAGLWIKYSSACMTGALYADTQAIVKSILLQVVYMQELDQHSCLDLKLHIILEVTDHVETVFRDLQMQDHAHNFDMLELVQKLSVSALVNAAYQQNPDIMHPHAQLSLKPGGKIWMTSTLPLGRETAMCTWLLSQSVFARALSRPIAFCSNINFFWAALLLTLARSGLCLVVISAVLLENMWVCIGVQMMHTWTRWLICVWLASQSGLVGVILVLRTVHCQQLKHQLRALPLQTLRDVHCARVCLSL